MGVADVQPGSNLIGGPAPLTVLGDWGMGALLHARLTALERWFRALRWWLVHYAGRVVDSR